MKKLRLIFVFLAILLIGTDARSEDVKYETGKYGILAFSACSSYWIGGIFHLSSNVSLKPSIMFLRDDNDEKGNGESVYERDYYGIEIGIYYYTYPVNNFSFFFGPEFGLTSSKFEYVLNDPDNKYTDHEKSYYVDLKIGAQYMFTGNFGLFADIGFGYSRDFEKTDSSSSQKNETENNVLSVKNFKTSNRSPRSPKKNCRWSSPHISARGLILC
jgi:hypothetical protein